MYNQKEYEKTISSKHFVQVFDDLYLGACTQKKLSNTITSIMFYNNRVAFKPTSYPYDIQHAFCVMMSSDLKQNAIFATTVYELIQYNLKKILYKPAFIVKNFSLSDPMTEYISKTLANPACFKCNHFGSETCKLHPKYTFPSGPQNRLTTWFKSLFPHRQKSCKQFEYNLKNLRDNCRQYCFRTVNNLMG